MPQISESAGAQNAGVSRVGVNESRRAVRRYLERVDSSEQDQQLFERLLELERPLVEAVWRQVIYGETLENVLAALEDPDAPDDGMEARVHELVSGAYRHIQRVEAKKAKVAN